MGILNKIFKEKKVNNHYKIPVECSNCDNVGLLMVVKGTPKNEAVKEDCCNMCGCETLKLITEQEYYKKKPLKKEDGLF